MTSINPEASKEHTSSFQSEAKEPAEAGSFASGRKINLPNWMKAPAVALGIVGAAAGGYIINEALSNETELVTVDEEQDSTAAAPSPTTTQDSTETDDNTASEVPQGFEDPEDLIIRWGYESSLIYYEGPGSVNKQAFVQGVQNDWLERLSHIELGDKDIEPTAEFLENTVLLFQEIGYGVDESVIAVHNPIVYGIGLETWDDGLTHGVFWHMPSETTYESYAVMFLDQNNKWQTIFMQPDHVGWSTYENLGLVGAFTEYGHTPKLTTAIVDYDGSEVKIGTNMRNLVGLQKAEEFTNLREAIEYSYRNNPNDVPYHNLESLVRDIRKSG